MRPELGQIALICAFLIALVQAGASLWGAARGNRVLMRLGARAAGMQGLLVLGAFGLLVWSFVRLDFSVALVARHAHSDQPLFYRIGATWGNHEGSMLLWILMLAAFGAMLLVWGQNLRASLRARVLGVQGLLGGAFLAFLLFTSNPFARLWPAPANGAELNPLLQDPGLIFHPPLLYAGYVGFSMVFSFAIAALIEGRVDVAWARWVRPWTLVAWIFLTLGITLGSFWAYYELGWGGYWFWDPVENASLLPWLVGTALLHSALVLERRGALAAWTIFLSIVTFSLSMIGTFLVRSGVLTSVHAFAVDPARGLYILLLILVATGSGLALFAWRAPAMRDGALFSALSREAALTLNNLLLLAAMMTVLLGTFYPLAAEALFQDKISVGPPFYHITFVPIFAVLLLLVTPGLALNWKRDDLGRVGRRLRWGMIGAVGIGVVLLAWLGLGNSLAILGLMLAAWLIWGAGAVLWRRWCPDRYFCPTWRLVRTTPLALYGVACAHAGLGVGLAGIVAMAAWETSTVAILQPGQDVALGTTRLQLKEMAHVQGPNYLARRAVFRLTLADGTQVPVYSERRFYPARRAQTTEVALSGHFWGNVYVAVGEERADGLVVRFHVQPLVGWIWGGGLLMALGGLLSLGDRRIRLGVATPAAQKTAP